MLFSIFDGSHRRTLRYEIPTISDDASRSRIGRTDAYITFQKKLQPKAFPFGYVQTYSLPSWVKLGTPWLGTSLQHFYLHVRERAAMLVPSQADPGLARTGTTGTWRSLGDSKNSEHRKLTTMHNALDAHVRNVD